MLCLRRGPPPLTREPITWSADSRHVAYPISGCVVLDGVEQKSFDSVSFFTVSFSSNGERLAFVATKDRDEFAVVDGVEGKKYPTVYRPEFSPDSKRVAYLARSEQPGNRWSAVVDGHEGTSYEDMGGPNRLFQDIRGQFSPGGKHFVYKAKRGGKWHVVVDAEESPAYDEFSMDDPITFDSPSEFHVVARRGADYFVLEGRFSSDNTGR